LPRNKRFSLEHIQIPKFKNIDKKINYYSFKQYLQNKVEI